MRQGWSQLKTSPVRKWKILKEWLVVNCIFGGHVLWQPLGSVDWAGVVWHVAMGLAVRRPCRGSMAHLGMTSSSSGGRKVASWNPASPLSVARDTAGFKATGATCATWRHRGASQGKEVYRGWCWANAGRGRGWGDRGDIGPPPLVIHPAARRPLWMPMYRLQGGTVGAVGVVDQLLNTNSPRMVNAALGWAGCVQG